MSATIHGSSTRVLGHLLIACGAATEADVAAALNEQQSTRERIGEVLVRRGTDPERVARCLAQQLRLPFASAPLEPNADALKCVNPALAARLRVVPLRVSERELHIAMADPLDARACDDLGFQTGRRIQPVVAVPAAIEAALARAYGGATLSSVLARIQPAGSGSEDDAGSLRRVSESAPVVELVNMIFARAVDAGASDVHVEPSGRGVRVRIRVDGLLRELMVLPSHAGPAVVSRIKIIARMDISVKRRPQDGRTTVSLAGREYVLRVSTLPCIGGEKVVVRLLDPANSARPLDALGMPEQERRVFAELLQQAHGVILVTGPTGSGKTTTLYSALSQLDHEQRNVLTLEDPVEYRLASITQVQVHAKAGLGFAAALRATLRQDPDVIMVGEMRDRETAETALSAALTGHLVLSTLHTNDAAGAITRLLEMGAASYLIASAVIGVVAQRLVRRVCTACAGSGCRACHAGFSGRVGLYEVLRVSPRIRELILARATHADVVAAARADGMRTLSEGGAELVREEVTTAAEIAPLLLAER